MTHKELNKILDNAETELDKGEYDTAEHQCKEVLLEVEGKSDTESIRLQSSSILILGVVASRKANYQIALNLLQKSLALAESISDKAGISETLRNIGHLYLYSDNQSALEYYQKALATAEEISDRNGIRKSLGSIGIVYDILSDYPQALEFYFKALAIAEEIGDKAGIGRNYCNIGIVYMNLSDYPRTLEYFQKALSIAEEMGDKSNIGSYLGNIGLVFSNLSNFPRALEFHHKALSITEEINDTVSVGRHQCNIGNVYRNLHDYTSALEFYYKSLAISEEIGHKFGICTILINIGLVYADLSDYPRAFECFQKSLSIAEEMGDKLRFGTNLRSIGILYANENFDDFDLRKAEEYLLRAFSIFEEIDAKQDKYECYHQLSEIYKQQLRWQEAFEHFEKFHQLEKEVQSEEAKKSTDRFEVQILIKEKEIERLKNVELAKANEELLKLNSEKNEFLGIAAHDLKNPLSAITTSIGILKRYGSRLTAEEVLEKHTDIERTSKRMLDIITNLLDINAIERGAIQFTSELFNLSETVQEVVDSNRQRAEEKSISIFFDLVPEPAEITADRQITSQVIDNLVSNAVKYSPQNKNVWVNVEPSEKSVKISVRDEGPGLSPEDMEKLFGRFQRLSAKPTGGEHSTGLGLSIVKKLVEAMNGKVWCESELGQGATFFVELPKSLINKI